MLRRERCGEDEGVEESTDLGAGDPLGEVVDAHEGAAIINVHAPITADGQDLDRVSVGPVAGQQVESVGAAVADESAGRRNPR